MIEIKDLILGPECGKWQPLIMDLINLIQIINRGLWARGGYLSMDKPSEVIKRRLEFQKENQTRISLDTPVLSKKLRDILKQLYLQNGWRKVCFKLETFHDDDNDDDGRRQLIPLKDLRMMMGKIELKDLLPEEQWGEPLRGNWIIILNK